MNRKGQTLVEFILVIPVFIMILFLVVDFGFIYSKKNELENISTDIVTMFNNNKSISEINSIYPDTLIVIKSDANYTTIEISEEINIITPGLNLIIGDPYKVVVERNIPNVQA